MKSPLGFWGAFERESIPKKDTAPVTRGPNRCSDRDGVLVVFSLPVNSPQEQPTEEIHVETNPLRDDEEGIV